MSVPSGGGRGAAAAKEEEGEEEADAEKGAKLLLPRPITEARPPFPAGEVKDVSVLNLGSPEMLLLPSTRAHRAGDENAILIGADGGGSCFVFSGREDERKRSAVKTSLSAIRNSTWLAPLFPPFPSLTVFARGACKPAAACSIGMSRIERDRRTRTGVLMLDMDSAIVECRHFVSFFELSTSRPKHIFFSSTTMEL